MATMDPLALTIYQRATSLKKAMKEVRWCCDNRRAIDALGMRNRPIISNLHDLKSGLSVLVWREKDKWTGFGKIIGLNIEDYLIKLPDRPTLFCSTSVKPYYSEDSGLSHPQNNSKDFRSPEPEYYSVVQPR